jgi:hypothetical protein
VHQGEKLVAGDADGSQARLDRNGMLGRDDDDALPRRPDRGERFGRAGQQAGQRSRQLDVVPPIAFSRRGYLVRREPERQLVIQLDPEPAVHRR